MLYRVIGEEVSTHRPIELPNWDAPNIATAKRRATQIGVVVLSIEPMDAPAREAQEDGGPSHNRSGTVQHVADPVSPPADAASPLLRDTGPRQPNRAEVVADGVTVTCLAVGVFFFVIGLAVWPALLLGACLVAVGMLISALGPHPDREARGAEEKRAKAARDAKLFCPHCQQFGQVITEPTTVKKGISGGKATAAVLTGGVTLLATGLSQEHIVTRATCSNCGSTWLF